jgi:hypothetical protein
MRHLLPLFRREWRDARAVTIASALVALLASIAINVWFFHWKEGDLTAMYLVPSLLALYLAAIGSDLVAAEVSTRRVDALALLPTSLRRVWTAKVLLLVVAGGVFLAWLLAVELTLLATFGEDGQLPAFLARLPDSLPMLAVAAALASATLFFSTMIERGFAAVVASLVVVGLGVWGWFDFEWSRYDMAQDPTRLAIVAVAAASVFAAGTPSRSSVARSTRRARCAAQRSDSRFPSVSSVRRRTRRSSPCNAG